MYSPELGTAHKVIFREGFELGKYVVTQGQWERVMGTRPWSGQGPRGHVQANVNHPAVYVSWFDVQEFIGKLNLLEVGQAVYRLPTEAEWEYAGRAGTTTRWSFGDDASLLGEYAWYRANAWERELRYAQPVGQKLPNPWGLYDMHGNVWEWVQDSWGAVRIYRGGGFSDLAQNTGSAFRNGGPPDLRLYDIGVRLVRVKEETSAAPAVGYSP